MKSLKEILKTDPIFNFSRASSEILKEHRTLAINAALKYCELAKAESRDFNEAEEGEEGSVEQYINEISAELESRENNRPAKSVYIAGKKAITGDGIMREMKLFNSGYKWRDIFGREPRPSAAFNNLGELVQAVNEGGTDERLKELRTMNTVMGSEGGFSIPEPVWEGIYDAGVEVSVVLDKVMNFPMATNNLTICAWDSDDHTQGPIASVEGQWLGEMTQATRKTPRMRYIKFETSKLAMYIAASSEILMDSAAAGTSIAVLLRNSLAFSLDETILTGSGISRPLGILSSGAYVAVDRSGAGTIGYTDIRVMMSRLMPSSMGRAIWLCSPSAFNALLSISPSTGADLLLQAPGGPAQKLPMTIFGMELRVTEKLPSLGVAGDLMLCDLSYYGLAQRETGRFEKTNAAQWTSDIVDFRLIVRCDGTPLIAQPYTPASGGATLSPFVVLK